MILQRSFTVSLQHDVECNVKVFILNFRLILYESKEKGVTTTSLISFFFEFSSTIFYSRALQANRLEKISKMIHYCLRSVCDSFYCLKQEKRPHHSHHP